MRTFLLGVLALAIFGFGAAQDMETIENPFVHPAEWSVDAEAAQYGGTLQSYSISDFDSYNPFLVASSPDLLDGGMELPWGGLVRRDPYALSTWIPYMAESYEANEDQTVLTFRIRQGMRFSDGEEITADDWVTTWRIHSDPDVGSNSYSSFFIEGDPVVVEKVDDYTLTITFPQADAGALSISSFTPWPDHVFGPVYEEGGAAAIQEMWTLSSDPSTFVSPGPFVAESYVPGERATFVRNPYFGTWNVDSQGNQLPYLDGVVITLVPDLNAALASYLGGQLDFGPASTVDQIQQIQAAIDAGQLDATLLPNQSGQASSQWITFNWNRADDPFKQELFRNQYFRQAMSHLADRDAMVRLVYGGLGAPIYTGVYPVLSDWINPDLEVYAYDPEAAERLLADIGFTQRDSDGTLMNAEGQRLEFNLITNAGNNQREQLAQIFADTAAEIGVRVNFQPVAFEVLVDQLTTPAADRGFDAILLGLTGGDIDWPFGVNVIPCGTNLHAFNYSPEGECLSTLERIAERLYFQGRRELDVEARREIGYQLQDAWNEMQGFIYLAGPVYNPTWNNRLGGNYPLDILSSLHSNAIFGPRDPALTVVR
jgi:peptide/nickel transport system substrate-binding protein